MCLAIVCEQGSNVVELEESIRNAWEDNPDGGGFAYIGDEGLCVRYGFRDIEVFIEELKVEFGKHNESSDFLVHLRFASAGDKNVENCHPFVTGSLAMIHNGTIQKFVEKGAESDTFKFAKYLEGLPDDWITSVALFTLVEDLIGASKVAFLLPDGQAEIMNISSWIYSDKGKIYYSNDYYKKTVKRKPTSDVIAVWNKCIVCNMPLHTAEERLNGICSLCDEDIHF